VAAVGDTAVVADRVGRMRGSPGQRLSVQARDDHRRWLGVPPRVVRGMLGQAYRSAVLSGTRVSLSGTTPASVRSPTRTARCSWWTWPTSPASSRPRRYDPPHLQFCPRTIQCCSAICWSWRPGRPWMPGASPDPGLCSVSGQAANPFEYADIVTTTTHKSLRGPRAGTRPVPVAGGGWARVTR
jgi:hypothetical protein